MFIPLYDDNSLRNVRFQYVTVTIIAINVVVWLITGTPAIMDEVGSRAASFSYGYIPAVANGLKTLPPDLVHLPVPATYVTYSFLHGSFMHLAGNMLFIWVFGDNVEDSMGHLRFAFFYLASAAAAAWTHGFFAPDSEGPLIGASGAAAGIIGVLINLLSNAAHALAAIRRDVPRIQVRVTPVGEKCLRVSVKDNGQGISPENIGRVFEPFFTTRDVGAGLGLGLSVSYGIVQRHGGTLTVDSVFGEWTEFSFELKRPVP